MFVETWSFALTISPVDFFIAVNAFACFFDNFFVLVIPEYFLKIMLLNDMAKRLCFVIRHDSIPCIAHLCNWYELTVFGE